MRTLRNTQFHIFLCLWALNSIAQQSSTTKNAQAVSAIQQSLLAMNTLGGALVDSIAQGTMTFSDGSSASISIKTRGANMLRHDLTFASDQISYVINAGQGYRIANGVKEDLPLHVTAYQRVEYIPALSRMTDYAGPTTNVAYVALEKVGNSQGQHIKLTDIASNPAFTNVAALNSEFHVYIDPTTNLVLQTRTFLFSPTAIENRFAVDAFYSDYRNINGVLVPFSVTRFISGQKYSGLQLSTVQIGVNLNSDSDFQ